MENLSCDGVDVFGISSEITSSVILMANAEKVTFKLSSHG